MPGAVAKKAAPKRKPLSFSVDCSRPVDDRIMNIAEFEKFLSENIKVSGKKGAGPALAYLAPSTQQSPLMRQEQGHFMRLTGHIGACLAPMLMSHPVMGLPMQATSVTMSRSRGTSRSSPSPRTYKCPSGTHFSVYPAAARGQRRTCLNAACALVLLFVS
jgi:Ribosomal L22e protein family